MRLMQERAYIDRRFKNDTERLEKRFELYMKMMGTPTSPKIRRMKKLRMRRLKMQRRLLPPRGKDFELKDKTRLRLDFDIPCVWKPS